MPSGIYNRKKCASGCTCGKHRNAEGRSKCEPGCKCKRHNNPKWHKARSESFRRQRSSDLREKVRNGTWIISPKSSRGKFSNFNGVTLRSSWELIFAKYCDAANIEWNYESVRIPYNGRTYIPDFLIDGILYEVGWQDKSEKMQAARIAGYKIYQFNKDEIDLMRMFI